MPKKKTFQDEKSVTQFFTPYEPEEQESQPAESIGTPQPPKGYKINPLYVEVKSRRIQLVLKPSLYERAKAKAAADGVSFNELVHLALEQYLGEDA